MATRLKDVPTVDDALNELKPQLEKLREPFEARHISKLPKPYKKDSPKGKCAECGGYHGLPAMHLDYVGHAALTDRLLDTDLEWSWEPAGFTPEGLPALDRNGGLWIKLTVCGVTRYGYGAADGKSGGDAMKEIIGDALRNAAMRFGAALDLWHKGDLHGDDTPDHDPVTGEIKERISTGEDKPKPRQKLADLDGKPAPYPYITHLMTAARQFVHTLEGMGDLGEFIAWGETEEVLGFVAQCKRDLPGWYFGGDGAPDDWVPLKIQIQRKRKELDELDEIRTSHGAVDA